LIERHTLQIADFEAWAADGNWEKFHTIHYDWWAFPINKSSGYGLAWTVYEGDIAALKLDANFTGRFQLGLELVAASWGWDLKRAAYIIDLQPGQSWHHWPVRLFKAALSAQLFGYHDLFGSLKHYAEELMNSGEIMEFNGYDLSWLFTTGIDPKTEE
jgi:hypothetical protein